jgi:hypothetical protein
MLSFSEFCSAAQADFGLNQRAGRGALNKHYVEVSARLTRGRLGGEFSASDDPPETINPVTILDDSRKAGDHPRVTFIVGQYGLGKTEFVFQVCRHLQVGRVGGPEPLPVNLGACRRELATVSEKSSPKDLAKMLFSHVEAHGDTVPAAELWRAVRTGQAILVLDGVDELLSRWRDLRRLLVALVQTANGSESDGGSFHLVLTTRLELLYAMGREDGEEIAKTVSEVVPGRRIDTYFLQFGFLQDSQVGAYLRVRLPEDGDDVFRKLNENKPLMDVVRRPLLLRTLCDLLARPGYEPLSLLKMQQPADLVREFVEQALNDHALVAAQGAITSELRWDEERLARKSLTLYENGRNELDLDDVKDILGVTAAPGRSIKPQDILFGIHKLPFLQRPDDVPGAETQVHFSHRIFFEYFVARGMLLTEGVLGFAAFDRLVLNVDMRKFLHGLMGDKKWFARTRRSYALEKKQAGEWKELGLKADLRECDEQRRILLTSMTDPELFAHDETKRQQLEATIYWFLGNEKQFHPRYLVYNYEAVAVYLIHQRWTDTGKAVREQLGRILDERLGAESKALDGRPPRWRDAWELVVERGLSIGSRLQYGWIGRWARADWSKMIRDENTLSRIRAIREEL